MPRYLAAARLDDLERTLRLADDLITPQEKRAPVCLLQCGRPSPLAAQLGDLLRKAGRYGRPVVISDRLSAQSDFTLAKLGGVGSVWVFAEDLFEAFMTVFATQLAFSLRARARQGLPVVGVGGGALALGGLVLANRFCRNAHFNVVSGLGWAPRVLVDGGADRTAVDALIARATVQSLPGLLGVDLGLAGGVKVQGGRVESVGSEPIALLGAAEDGSVLGMSLEPGQRMTIAPPPFAPFERRLLPAALANALTVDTRPEPPAAPSMPPADVATPLPGDDANHSAPGSNRVCPMCHKVHAAEARLELAA
jgi:hypothetical protein